MVIPQVFGSSSVLYRVGAPLFMIMLFVSALLSVVYGATPCTIDVIMRCYYRVYSSRGSFAGVLPRGDCRRAMPACSSITKVW